MAEENQDYQIWIDLDVSPHIYNRCGPHLLPSSQVNTTIENIIEPVQNLNDYIYHEEEFDCEIFPSLSEINNEIGGLQTPFSVPSFEQGFNNNIYDDPTPTTPSASSQKYRCCRCRKIFDRLAEFKLHRCSDNDPDLVCDKCHKVFNTKSILRRHLKIHSRLFPCNRCTNSYTAASALCKHVARVHYIYMCDSCTFSTKVLADLNRHKEEHKKVFMSAGSNESDSQPENIFESQQQSVQQADFSRSTDQSQLAESLQPAHMVVQSDLVQQADYVIAKVKSNELFHYDRRINKRLKNCNMSCEFCFKKFKAVADLKRHLIVHVIQSTLAKKPVDAAGDLNIRCEICQEKVFSRLEPYRIHLKKHANLKTYTCTKCNYECSDLRYFKTHDKVHTNNFILCDICRKAFKSKPDIIRHIKYHIQKINHRFRRQV